MIDTCFVCQGLFAFDPTLVPSVMIDPETDLPPDLGGDPHRARPEPICRNCVEDANAERILTGKLPIRVMPGAYQPA